MRRSRRRGHGGPKTQPGPQEAARTPGPQPREAPAGDKGAALPAMLRITLEKAADMAKRELASRGRVEPMAVFCYGGQADAGEAGGHVFKAVSLVWRTELQNEAVRRRVREKIAAEGAAALVVLTRAAGEGTAGRQKENPDQKGTLVFTGAMPGARGVARVAYVFQREAKTFTSWDMRLSSETLENFFLDGIFPPPRSGR